MVSIAAFSHPRFPRIAQNVPAKTDQGEQSQATASYLRPNHEMASSLHLGLPSEGCDRGTDCRTDGHSARPRLLNHRRSSNPVRALHSFHGLLHILHLWHEQGCDTRPDSDHVTDGEPVCEGQSMLGRSFVPDHGPHSARHGHLQTWICR